jgi:eukaryotic-like serine/threonine-protein kinase
MLLSAGTKFGPFVIVEPLGAGGMGEVYRAQDTRLGRDVAIKVLPESFAGDSDRLRRFEQEAQAVAALNHPNILAIHDIGTQNGAPYLVSELLEGNTLRAELEQGRLGSRKIVDCAVQMAQGLAAAHEKHIVHRDLKPENVWITKDGRVKILDFGLAKLAAPGGESASMATLTSPPTEPGKVLGTVGYMAPEQVRGASVDTRTDIFSFGAVLYEMVAGLQPFRRDTAAETMTAILKEEPPELSEMPQPASPGMQRIIGRCLEKKPEQRFQSAKDLAFALEALTGTSTKSAANLAIVEQQKSWKRWPGTLAAVGIPLGLILGAAATWFLRPTPEPIAPFRQASFHRGEVIRARFGPDEKTLVYSAKLNGNPMDTYVLRAEYPEPVAAGLNGALLEAVSRQGQLAVLVRPQYFAHKTFLGTLATTPMGGNAPREIMDNVSEADWSPDGQQLAIIDRPGAEWRLQYPIGKILWSGSNWISDVRVSADGKRVTYFRHPPNIDDRGDVMVVEEDGKPRVLVGAFESLAGLAWDPSGKEIWFSASQAGQQYCIHAVTLKGKERTMHCGAAPTIILDFSASGRALVMAMQARVSMAVLEHGAKEEKDLTWLDFAYNPRLSRDGSEVLFTDQTGQGSVQYGVYVRKRDGSPAVRIGENGFGSDITPDGKFALVVNADDTQRHIQIVPVGTGEKKILHWDGVQPIWAQWFPDGEHILLTASIPPGKPAGLYVTDAQGATPRLIVEGAQSRAGVSPDGAWIIYGRDGKRFIQSTTSTEMKDVPNFPTDQRAIAWSAGAEHLFTQAADDSGVQLSRLDLKTGIAEPWQTIRPKDQVGQRPMSNPVAITPDGKWMAYYYVNELDQLYVTDGLK